MCEEECVFPHDGFRINISEVTPLQVFHTHLEFSHLLMIVLVVMLKKMYQGLAIMMRFFQNEESCDKMMPERKDKMMITGCLLMKVQKYLICK